MNMPNKNQQQIEFEVFPKNDDKFNYSYLSGVRSETSQETTPINVVFSYQSVIIIFICVLMLLIASFTLGVEKGKLMAKNGEPTAKPVSGTSVETPVVQEAARVTQEKLASSVPVKSTVAETPMVVATQSTPVAIPKETTAVPSSGYTIQVASVQSEKAAKTLSENLLKKGIASYTKASGKYIMVLAGNFSKKEEAQGTLKDLKKTYTDCFIKKI